MPFQLDIPPPRFGEFDLGGVLYHANYFHIYEIMREAFLANGPTSYASLVKKNFHLAVVESRQNFLKPIYYGDPFKTELIISELKQASITVEYRFYKEHTIHLAQTRLVFINSSSGVFSVTPMPKDLKDYFSKFKEQSHFK